MAAFDRLRTLSWYYQFAFFFLVFVAVVAAGETLGVSWVVSAREERARLESELETLRANVNKLRVVEQQHSEFQTRVKALEEQLGRLQTFVPAEKQTDDFLRLLQTSSLNAQISLRRLTAKPVVMKEFYAEMPFEVELDGPYYNLMEFFNRLGTATRIVNAGTLKLAGLTRTSTKYDYVPGTTVAGVCTVTTFYTPSEAELAAAAPPPTRGGARPGARGGS